MKCMYCEKEIRDDAIICKYCNKVVAHVLSEKKVLENKPTESKLVGCSWPLRLLGSVIVGVAIAQIPSQILLARKTTENLILIVGFSTLIISGVIAYILTGLIKGNPQQEKMKHRADTVPDVKEIIQINNSNEEIKTTQIDMAVVNKMYINHDIDGLIKALKNQADAEVREFAATALRQYVDNKAVEPLIIATQDTDKNVRLVAVEALLQTLDVRAVKSFVVALNDSDKDVRWRAAQALGHIHDGQEVEPLIASLKDPEYKVRERAAFALGKIRDVRAVEPLIATLKEDCDGDVRSRAAFVLGEIGDRRAIEALNAALNDPQSLLLCCNVIRKN